MYSVIDQRTGEIIAENFIFFGKPRKHHDKGYVKVFTAFLDSVVEDDEIAGKAIRLLFYMLTQLDYNSLKVTIIPQRAIKDLGIYKDTFYRWVKVLEKKGIIRKIDRYTYELTPYRFVKGSMKATIGKQVSEHLFKQIDL